VRVHGAPSPPGEGAPSLPNRTLSFHSHFTLAFARVVNNLLNSSNFYTDCDSAKASAHLYEKAKEDVYTFLSDSSHRERLAKIDLEKDIRYCLQESIIHKVPFIEKGTIVCQ